jgi:hypothetical protein
MGSQSFDQWRNEHHIEVLLANPAVRFRIEQASQSSSRPMSGEEFLKRYSAIVSVIPGLHALGAATLVGGLVGQKMGQALGIRVKRAASMSYPEPIGQVTAALLCVLVRKGYPIQRIVQGEDGSFMEAALPSNWQSWKGTIACTVVSRAAGTEIQIGTVIRGQALDWGRSAKIVSVILDEVRVESASF